MTTITNNTITSYYSACAGSNIRVKLYPKKYATLRLNKEGQIRDGKVYGSERTMKSNRKSRPADARMFYVESKNRGFFTLVEIA